MGCGSSVETTAVSQVQPVGAPAPKKYDAKPSTSSASKTTRDAPAGVEATPQHDPCPTDGVALWSVREFMGQHSIAGFSTSKVCGNVVKPATRSRACAYVELLRGRRNAAGVAAVARATVFLSHAWGNSFEDMIDAAETHLAGEAGTAYVWIDIFTVNQHNQTCSQWGCACGSLRQLPAQEWWSGAFKDAIVSFKRMLIVMEPWNKPAPLTRAWCLWELLCAVEGAAQIDVVLSPREEAAFKEALEDDFDSIIASLSNVDARKADAFKHEDLAMIRGAVEADVGFEKINIVAIGLMRDWVAARGRHELALLPARERGTSALLNNLASLLKDQGKLDEAEPLYSEALAAKREVLGERHPDTLAGMNKLASLLRSQGKLDEAEPLYREALAAMMEVLGERHPDTLEGMHNLAILLEDQGKLDEAEPL